MNRLLYILLIAALAVMGFSMYKKNDLGSVSFSFSGIDITTNLVVFIAVLLCVIFAVSMLIKITQAIVNVSSYYAKKRRKQLEEEARLSLSHGLIEYAEGRFEQSEKVLLQHVKYSNNQLLVYLTAARAAQQLGAHERRDEYLQKAHKQTPNADLAISLTKAELQLAHNQNVEALATLTQLNLTEKNHPYVLVLLANTYQHLQNWDNLKSILPQLKKYSNLSEDSFLSFETSACNAQLSTLANNIKSNTADKDGLTMMWNETAQHLKALPNICEHYAKQLVAINAYEEAENVLRLFLNETWHESTIILYSELNVSIDNKQLEMIEAWLKDHQHNAYLLLALGKRCISNSLWGKARNYLEASVSINPMPENYLILARLLEEHMGIQDASQEYYRQGLHLLVDDYGDSFFEKKNTSNDDESPQLKIIRN